MLDKILTEDLTHPNWTADAVAGFSRNKVLIDLTQIPTEIKEKIINTYEEIVPAKRNKLLNYFIEHKLKNLLDVIEEF